MILDSDVLIDLIREQPASTAWLEGLPELPHAAGFAAMELVAGSQSAKELRDTQTFLSAYALAWPSEAEMAHALTDLMPLRLAHGIGLLDTVIAATARGRKETLVTFNVRHYRHVPGLVTLQPYTR